MAPLATRQAPVTPPRASTTVAVPAATLSTKPALVPLSLGSSSPVPSALPSNAAGAPVKHAHFDEGALPVDEDVLASPTRAALQEDDDEAKSSRRRMKRAERERLSRSEGGENADAHQEGVQSAAAKSGQPRRATFSKVVSSNRTSLAGLGQPQSTGVSTPPRAGSYIPPHLRSHSSSVSSQVPLKNLFAAFDRSACPEPEDSFYSNVSNLSLGGSPTSSAYTTPNASRFLAHPPGLVKPLYSPYQSSPVQPAGPTPLSPTTLISRGPYLDPIRFPHPGTISEEDELDVLHESNFERSWADAVDLDERLLSEAEEAALGTDEGVEVQVRMGGRRRSSAFISSLGLPEDEVGEDACSGCEAQKNLAFVVLIPCRHGLCHVCVNALVNGAAHKPPRPMDCFSCAAYVESLEPAAPQVSVVHGGNGLTVALKHVLDQEKAQQSVVPKQSTTAEQNEDEAAVMFTRARRRRSSVVAAAIAATILASSSPIKPSDSRSRSSTIGSSGSFGSLSSLPSSSADHDSLSPSTSKAIPPSRRRSLVETPDLFGYSQTPASTDGAKGVLPLLSTSSSDPIIPNTVDWPVVRLDNVPWEVTAAEIEAWAGDGNLASDLDEDELRKGEGEGDGKIKRVTLAVHILCNRADGRTLNQAYLECSSRSAARSIVRLKDGSKLRNRPVHVSLSSQGEFLTTLFPTYTPGFSSLEPNSNPRSKWAAPIPLLLQTELTGLLNLCRLESAHAKKVAERPFFNIVTLLEKMPWSFPSSYNSQAVVRLFNTACAAIEILGSIKHSIPGWKDIVTVLVDAILHCPVFRPQQKQKAVHMAANIGGFQQTTRRKSFSANPAKQTIRGGVFDTFSFTPSALKETYVGTAPDKGFLAAKQAAGDLKEEAHLVEVGLPSPRFLPEAGVPAALQSAPSSPTTGNTVVPRHRRRRSSVAAQLNIDKALVESVAQALGIALEPSSPVKLA
ncbi:hypothetical protein JCM8547_007208 [Rhodosporidiobolus lusitaniae]